MDSGWNKGRYRIDFSAIIQQNLALLGYLCRQKNYKKPKDFSQVKSLGNKFEMPANIIREQTWNANY